MSEQNRLHKERNQEEELKIVDRRHHLKEDEPDDKEKEIETAEEPENEETNKEQEQYLRLLADFENYRKRTAKVREQSRQLAENTLFCQLFPLFENLEKTLLEAEKEPHSETLTKGLSMVLKMWHILLSQNEINSIPQEGERFNPMFHEAVLVKESEAAEGTILEVLQKGYVRKETVLLPAKVVVAKSRQKDTAPEEAECTEKSHA